MSSWSSEVLERNAISATENYEEAYQALRFSNGVKIQNYQLVQPPLVCQNDEVVSEDNPQSYYVYIMTNGIDFYVGKGISDSCFHQLMNTGVLLHLIDEGKVIKHSLSRSTKLQILSNTLALGRRVAVIKILPETTEGQALFNEALLYQVLIDLNSQPNMNAIEPMPYLKQFLTAGQLNDAKGHMLYMLSNALSKGGATLFDRGSALTFSQKIFETFKLSPLYKSGIKEFESRTVAATVSNELMESNPIRLFWAARIARLERQTGYNLSNARRFNILQALYPDKSASR